MKNRKMTILCKKISYNNLIEKKIELYKNHSVNNVAFKAEAHKGETVYEVGATALPFRSSKI